MVNQPLNNIPNDLISAIKNIYKPAGMQITATPSREAESSEYGACRFDLNQCHIAFRVAKITPTKIGQFVTLWKRPKPSDHIMPLDITDNIDFVIIHVSDGIHHGQFIFNQKILCAKGILSHGDKKGKLAFRVYPAWTNPSSKQALKTQQWQLPYFLLIAPDGSADLTQIRQLFKKNREMHETT